jgi:hypothetical protein
MSERTQGYRHFDLPVDWLRKSGGWVPPKSQDPQEIAEFKSAPKGTVILRRQRIGTDVAAHMLDFMSERDIESPTARLLASAGLVTAWHNLAEDVDNRMRKVTHLPVHIHTKGSITAEGLTASSAELLHAAAEHAKLMSKEHDRKGSLVLVAKNRLGKVAANASLTLASAPHAATIAAFEGDDETMQHFARQGAIAARELALDMQMDPRMGVYPSLAQLAHTHSPMASYIQNYGDGLSREALDYAQSEVFEASRAA